jgi:hypothetical protein
MNHAFNRAVLRTAGFRHAPRSMGPRRHEKSPVQVLPRSIIERPDLGRAAVSSGFAVGAQLITLMSLFVGASGLSSC